MKVKIGKCFEKEARGVFAVTLEEDFDVVTALYHDDDTAMRKTMRAGGLVASVLCLKDEGWSLDRVLMTATDAYKNGWR